MTTDFQSLLKTVLNGVAVFPFFFHDFPFFSVLKFSVCFLFYVYFLILRINVAVVVTTPFGFRVLNSCARSYSPQIYFTTDKFFFSPFNLFSQKLLCSVLGTSVVCWEEKKYDVLCRGSKRDELCCFVVVVVCNFNFSVSA